MASGGITALQNQECLLPTSPAGPVAHVDGSSVQPVPLMLHGLGPALHVALEL